jgi:hypothetical protein
MKRLPTLLLFYALFSPVALLAVGFEGNVLFKITTGQSSHDIDYRVKGGLARIDVQTKDATACVIIDSAKQEVTVLILERKMYMVQSIAGKVGATANIDTSQTSFEKTGVTEKILGYDCTKYIAKSKETTSEIWATDELGAFLGFGFNGGDRRAGAAAGSGQAWEAALAGKNFFPLRVTAINSNGKEINRLEATAVEKKTLPDTDFAPPSDFQKLDLGALIRGSTPGR